ncbi:hypothetical protein [Sulfobacillus thermosulfidooxidans]|nr:hypothetical protein [Sulfobacillus thermosulfidooxidans]
MAMDDRLHLRDQGVHGMVSAVCDDHRDLTNAVAEQFHDGSRQ